MNHTDVGAHAVHRVHMLNLSSDIIIYTMCYIPECLDPSLEECLLEATLLGPFLPNIIGS